MELACVCSCVSLQASFRTAHTLTYRLFAITSFDVQVGGEVVLPTTVILRNRVTRLAGRMTGVEEVVVERQSAFYVLDQAHTSQVRFVRVLL